MNWCEEPINHSVLNSKEDQKVSSELADDILVIFREKHFQFMVISRSNKQQTADEKLDLQCNNAETADTKRRDVTGPNLVQLNLNAQSGVAMIYIERVDKIETFHHCAVIMVYICDELYKKR